MPDHTKRLDSIRLVALMPGWAMAWTAWKTARRHGSGTRGRTVPADTSHHSSHPSTAKVRMLSEGEELAATVAAHDRCSPANQAYVIHRCSCRRHGGNLLNGLTSSGSC